MAKKFHKKAKEIRKLQAQHANTAPTLSTDQLVVRTGNFSDTIAHNAHDQVRKDMVFLGIVMAVILVVLLVINWAIHNTNLSKLITG